MSPALLAESSPGNSDITLSSFMPATVLWEYQLLRCRQVVCCLSVWKRGAGRGMEGSPECPSCARPQGVPVTPELHIESLKALTPRSRLLYKINLKSSSWSIRHLKQMLKQLKFWDKKKANDTCSLCVSQHTHTQEIHQSHFTVPIIPRQYLQFSNGQYTFAAIALLSFTTQLSCAMNTVASVVYNISHLNKGIRVLSLAS